MKDTVALRRAGLCINQQQFRFQNLASPLPVTVIFFSFFACQQVRFFESWVLCILLWAWLNYITLHVTCTGIQFS
jgi:hypothetical protein